MPVRKLLIFKSFNQHFMKKTSTKKQHVQNLTLLLTIIFGSISSYAQTTLVKVDSFNTNPANLGMYMYVPEGESESYPLVIALHGCTQSASSFANLSGWNKLAERHKFLVVYPEKTVAINGNTCFNWFDSISQIRNQNEVLSIKQMIDYMASHYAVDPSRIFVTGLSGGGAMTSVMLATYPDVFNKGAIMAGVPYKASKNVLTAFYAMRGFTVKTADEWGDLVRSENPEYTGEYPDVAVFHGSIDSTVYLVNSREIIKQWTNVNNADATPDFVDTAFNGDSNIKLSVYNDSIHNTPSVYSYQIKGMKHGYSLDTGACPRQGGAVAPYAFEKDFHSTYWAADFFGIITQPFAISGDTRVAGNEKNVIYHVDKTLGSIYTWTVPAGAIIKKGQGENKIAVDFAGNGGLITVEELTADGCLNDKVTLNVKIGKYNNGNAKSGIYASLDEEGGQLVTSIYPNPFSGSATLQFAGEQTNLRISIVDLYGKELRSVNFSGTQYTIEKGDLVSGIYFVKTQDENNITSNYKIVIQ